MNECEKERQGKNREDSSGERNKKNKKNTVRRTRQMKEKDRTREKFRKSKGSRTKSPRGEIKETSC